MARESGVPIDPLQRVFVPIEKRMTNGNLTFQTTDHQRYIRSSDGSIRRSTPKVNGKDAKKARQKCRR